MSEYPVHVPDPPSPATMNWVERTLSPLARVTQPTVYGIENALDSGGLYVGNHTIYGLLDVPFMCLELWRRREVTLRGLGEHAHYAVPIWRDLLERVGMVRGTRDNVRELMHRGENILVFPGGAREVNKRKGEKYELIWRERLGFARLAIEHSYSIVPFAAVGAEEMLDVIVDETNPAYQKFAAATKKVTGLPLPPIVRGLGPTPLPRPQRLYFWFGGPIRTRRWSGLDEDIKAQRAVRDQVKADVESGIEFLLAERARAAGG
jgi:1-acyl-sn-glycerol-3-phosphate acyltransferase